ncbi:MAG: phenylalanine--tRNA ligase subunit alpha [Nanoarchaeota archaeon]
MDYHKIVKSLTPLERKIFPILTNNSKLTQIIKETKLKEVEVMRALQWLENKGLIKLERDFNELIELDENGKKCLREGLPEKRFLQVLTKPLILHEIRKRAKLDNDEFNVAFGIAKKSNLIELGKQIKITENGKNFLRNYLLEDLLKKLPKNLDELNLNEKEKIDELKKRKQFIKSIIIKDRKIILTKDGENLKQHKLEHDLIESLTPEMIRNKSWKDKEFRHYDTKINVPNIYASKRHFVNQAIQYVKKIWLELGFKEMTGNLIQTSFWNFDALYTAQDHPARDMQDTFFIKDPKHGNLPSIYNNVKKAHENGVANSKGYNYSWNLDEAKQNILRTHNTVLSARTIANLKKEKLPAKFFAVGKVFRNETVDWSHLFEFNQTEGIVIDENVNFKHLLGYLKQFFSKMGFEKIKFRPVYFPFTEPSVEVIVYHPIKKIWIELGGAGIFRPEVVQPLLGKNIPVLAWGLGLERIITDYYEIQDLREVYSNDIKKLRETKLWIK